MSHLVIDIGNTNTKLAVFDQNNLVHFQQMGELDRAKLMELIEHFGITAATVSSVDREVGQLGELLAKAIDYIPFGTSITGGIENRYGTPATLGHDRWAKVLAASRLFPDRNCLMIDAGTCITYDVLTKNKVYSGGSISLGIKMRFEALNHYTGRLPLVDWDRSETVVPPGTDTLSALKNGVLQGVVYEVEGFISAGNRENEGLTVILTGGDADFLNKQLKNSIFASQIIHEPYLVLKGLNEAITLSYVQ